MVIGIDWGATFFKLGLFSRRGDLHSIYKFPALNFSTPGLFKKHFRNFLNTLPTRILNLLKSVGIGVPGIVSSERGFIYYLPNIPGWENFHFRDWFKKNFYLDLALDNDGNLNALAELKRGKARGLKTAIVFTLGTGLGCGLIINGKVFHSRTSASEAAHIPLEIEGIRCGCGSRGCVETFLGNRYILKRLRNILGPKSFLARIKDLTPYDLYLLAKKNNNKLALKCWDYYGKILGIFSSGLINLLAPEAIILGGGLAGAFRFFKRAMWDEINRRSMKPNLIGLKILKSNLGSKAGIIGGYELLKENKRVL